MDSSLLLNTDSPLTSVDSETFSGDLEGVSETSEEVRLEVPNHDKSDSRVGVESTLDDDSDDGDEERVGYLSARKLKRNARSYAINDDDEELEEDRKDENTIDAASTSLFVERDLQSEEGSAGAETSNRNSRKASKRSRQDRESNSIKIEGNWGPDEAGSASSSWAVRQKRSSERVPFDVRSERKKDRKRSASASISMRKGRQGGRRGEDSFSPEEEVGSSVGPSSTAKGRVGKRKAAAPEIKRSDSVDETEEILQEPEISSFRSSKKAKSKKVAKDERIDSEESYRPDVRSISTSKKAPRDTSYSPADQPAVDDQGRGDDIDRSVPSSFNDQSQSKSKIFPTKKRVTKSVKSSSIEESSYDSLFDPSLSQSDVEYDRELESKSELSVGQVTATKKRSSATKKKAPSTGIFAWPADTALEKDGMRYIRQYKQCLGFEFKVQYCRHCTMRQAGDSCRFLQIRAFPVKIEGEKAIFVGEKEGNPTSSEQGTIFIDDATQDENANHPDHFDLNRAMDEDSRRQIMTTAAVSLVGILEKALLHTKKAGCFRRTRELQIRAMCDFCSTGIFASSYMCKTCGGEFCLSCRETMESMDDAEEKDKAGNQLFNCVKNQFALVKKHKNYHSVREMIPVTRFSEEELSEEVEAMRETVRQSSNSQDSLVTQSLEESYKDKVSPAKDEFTEDSEELGPISIPSHPLTVEKKSTLNEEIFLATWAKGHPLLVTNIETPKTWDPQAFIKKYGDMECEIVRCDAQPPLMTKTEYQARMRNNPSYFHRWAKLVRVRQFFESFGKSEEERKEMMGKGIWKLKDWPPAAEFHTSFPDIYEDFNYAVPMPDYTRRDGCKNLSSLFPKNVNGPDLGPKMYNAWTGEHTKGKKGTTCLHMDIADAVNILLYTADMESHESAAQWDIFRAEDANAIRDFLREKHPGITRYGDPIHNQVHYLDDDALEQLYREKGVHSWRILQRAGQAVFIPAGCAHQVCNLTDCIKVAVDFISPQNVARCFRLTEEFRGLVVEGRKSWKEDVLQLKAQLWYAWRACRDMGAAPSDEEFAAGKVKRESQVKEAEQKLLERRRPLSRPRKGKGVMPLQEEVYTPRGTMSRRTAASTSTEGSKIKEEVVVEDLIKTAATDREEAKLSIDATTEPLVKEEGSGDGLLSNMMVAEESLCPESKAITVNVDGEQSQSVMEEEIANLLASDAVDGRSNRHAEPSATSLQDDEKPTSDEEEQKMLVDSIEKDIVQESPKSTSVNESTNEDTSASLSTSEVFGTPDTFREESGDKSKSPRSTVEDIPMLELEKKVQPLPESGLKEDVEEKAFTTLNGREMSLPKRSKLSDENLQSGFMTPPPRQDGQTSEEIPAEKQHVEQTLEEHVEVSSDLPSFQNNHNKIPSWGESNPQASSIAPPAPTSVEEITMNAT